METKFTPGPWTYAGCFLTTATADGRIDEATSLLVAEFLRFGDRASADASLIAAAPDLFDAGRHALEWMEAACTDPNMQTIRDLRAALRKARGEQ